MDKVCMVMFNPFQNHNSSLQPPLRQKIKHSFFDLEFRLKIAQCDENVRCVFSYVFLIWLTSDEQLIFALWASFPLISWRSYYRNFSEIVGPSSDCFVLADSEKQFQKAFNRTIQIHSRLTSLGDVWATK